jgi:hypothetical protein
VNRRTDADPERLADELSDQDAGKLLLAFLAAVLLVLAVGTFPLSLGGVEATAGHGGATSHLPTGKGASVSGAEQISHGALQFIAR